MKESSLESLSNIFSNASWDIVALLVFVAVGFFYGLLSGRTRLIAILLALYISQLLFENFRFLDAFIAEKGTLEMLFIRLAIFTALVVVLSFFFSRILFISKSVVSQKWWQIFLLSFLGVGLFVSMVFRLLPDIQLFTFSPLVQYLFASPSALFWWLLLPLPVLFFIMRKQINRP